MRGDPEVLRVSGPRGWAAIPYLPPRASQSSKLELVAPFTDASGTLAAMRMAAQLGRSPDARINLVALQAVPYELELTRPSIALGWLEEKLFAVASKVPIDTCVNIILCRDARWALRQVLAPHSLVVIGARRRWWRTKEQRLAERLRQDGHQVISAYLQ